MNRKQHGFTKIYILDKNTSHACVEQINENLNESQSILVDMDCQKIACTIKKREHFDKIYFTIIFFTMIFTISMTKSSKITYTGISCSKSGICVGSNLLKK